MYVAGNCDAIAGPKEPQHDLCFGTTTTITTTTNTTRTTAITTTATSTITTTTRTTTTTSALTTTIPPKDLSGILWFGGSYHNDTQVTNKDVTFVTEDSWCKLPNVTLPGSGHGSQLLAVQQGRRIFVCGFYSSNRDNNDKDCYVTVSNSLASDGNWVKIASRSFSNGGCAYTVLGSTLIATTGTHTYNNLFEFFDLSNVDNQWETVDLKMPNIPKGIFIDSVLQQN